MTRIEDINLCDDVSIKITEIIRTSTNDRTRRRQDEKQAVLSLVHAIFGQSATVGHNNDGSPFIIPNQTPFKAESEVSRETTPVSTENSPVSTPKVTDAPEISVSHSRTHAVLAVAPYRIGIDIESYRSALTNVSRRFLSPDEQAVYAVSHELLLLAWTAKEAVYKAAGIPGLDFSRHISLSLDLTEPLTATVTPSTNSQSSPTPLKFTLISTTISNQTLTLAIPK